MDRQRTITTLVLASLPLILASYPLDYLLLSKGWGLRLWFGVLSYAVFPELASVVLLSAAIKLRYGWKAAVPSAAAFLAILAWELASPAAVTAFLHSVGI